KSRAVARRERTDRRGGQDSENATPRRCGRPRDVFEHRASVRARAALQGSRRGGSRRGSAAGAGARERNGVVSARRDLWAAEVFRQGRGAVQGSACRKSEK